MTSSINRPDGPQRAAESADHSGGYSALKAVGISDGYHQLAHSDDFESPSAAGMRWSPVNANHRQVGVRIFSDQARFQAAAVGKRHAELAGAMNHVAVLSK